MRTEHLFVIWSCIRIKGEVLKAAFLAIVLPSTPASAGARH